MKDKSNDSEEHDFEIQDFVNIVLDKHHQEFDEILGTDLTTEEKRTILKPFITVLMRAIISDKGFVNKGSGTYGNKIIKKEYYKYLKENEENLNKIGMLANS